jgi:hypothetical protein
LEEVMVLAVHDRDVHVHAVQRASRVEAAEASSDDDDLLTLAHGQR